MYAQVRMPNGQIDKQNYPIFSKKLFTFSCLIGGLEQGDLIACSTIYGYLICEFSNYTDKPYGDGSDTKPVLCKLDLKHHIQKKKIVDFMMG